MFKTSCAVPGGCPLLLNKLFKAVGLHGSCAVAVDMRAKELFRREEIPFPDTLGKSFRPFGGELDQFGIRERFHVESGILLVARCAGARRSHRTSRTVFSTEIVIYGVSNAAFAHVMKLLMSVFIVVTPIIGWLATLTGKRFRQLAKRMIDSQTQIIQTASETIKGCREIRIFGTQQTMSSCSAVVGWSSKAPMPHRWHCKACMRVWLAKAVRCLPAGGPL